MEERKKQRDSRGAQGAQRRREIREEMQRLQRLREKQKRRAKRRTGKPINKGVYQRLAVMVGVVLAVVLSMVIFFRVEHIQVQGNRYYSAEEIQEVCGVAAGDNLLILSRGEIAANIRENLKYIDGVKVTRQLPNTVIVTVTEQEPNYVVCDEAGEYYLITAKGIAVRGVSPQEAKAYIMVENMKVKKPTMGEKVSCIGVQFSVLTTVLQELEAAELVREISSVSLLSATQISLWYGERFEVTLGTTARLDYKLEYLKAVVAAEESYVTGKIDLRLTDGDRAYIDRDR